MPQKKPTKSGPEAYDTLQLSREMISTQRIQKRRQSCKTSVSTSWNERWRSSNAAPATKSHGWRTQRFCATPLMFLQRLKNAGSSMFCKSRTLCACRAKCIWPKNRHGRRWERSSGTEVSRPEFRARIPSNMEDGWTFLRKGQRISRTRLRPPETTQKPFHSP